MEIIVRNSIIEHLSTHDALCVDNFGMFLVKYQNAKIDFVAHIALPPTKEIVFNSEIISETDRLHSVLISKYGVTLEKASELVSTFVEQIRSDLYASGSSTIQGLGTFFLSNNFIRFEQDKKININNDSFGLPRVNFDKFVQQSQNLKLRPAMHKSEDLDEFQSGKPLKSKKKNLLVYISIPFVLMLASAGFLWENRQNQTYASFNPFSIVVDQPVAKKHQADSSSFNYDDPMGRNTSAGSVEKKEQIDIEYNKEQEVVNEVTIGAVKESNEEIVDQEKLAKSTTVLTSGELVSEKTDRFYIVCASFITLKKAEEFANQLESKGVETFKIIEPHGNVDRYRITLNDFDTQKEALNEAKTLREKFGEELWVYKY